MAPPHSEASAEPGGRRPLVRRYREGDKERVKALILSGLGEYGFRLQPEWFTDLDRIEEVYLIKGGTFFVLELDGEVIGTVGVEPEVPGVVAELRRLSVDPRHRGKGYGQLLMEKALEFCREQGYRRATLGTGQMMAAAAHIYEKLGFAIMEEEDHWRRYEKVLEDK